MVATPLPTIRDQRTLTGWVTPATEKTPPCNSGGFTLKGSAAMKKYYPVDFDEKGNAVLGRAKNTPTSNGFVPTTWTPGGGSEEEGDGIKSITITPAIETTPALDSLFPMYLDENIPVEDWPDVRNVNIATSTTLQVGDEYTVTVTPTEGSIVSVDNVDGTEPGASVSRTETVTTEDDFKFFSSLIRVEQGAETCMNVTFVVHQE